MNWELLGVIVTWLAFVSSIAMHISIEYVWRTDLSVAMLYDKSYKFVFIGALSGLILSVYYFG